MFEEGLAKRNLEWDSRSKGWRIIGYRCITFNDKCSELLALIHDGKQYIAYIYNPYPILFMILPNIGVKRYYCRDRMMLILTYNDHKIIMDNMEDIYEFLRPYIYKPKYGEWDWKNLLAITLSFIIVDEECHEG